MRDLLPALLACLLALPALAGGADPKPDGDTGHAPPKRAELPPLPAECHKERLALARAACLGAAADTLMMKLAVQGVVGQRFATHIARACRPAGTDQPWGRRRLAQQGCRYALVHLRAKRAGLAPELPAGVEVTPPTHGGPAGLAPRVVVPLPQ